MGCSSRIPDSSFHERMHEESKRDLLLCSAAEVPFGKHENDHLFDDGLAEIHGVSRVNTNLFEKM